MEKKYINFKGTVKQDCHSRTCLNRLSRNLNSLRKEKANPYRINLKLFKAKIDNLRNYFSRITTRIQREKGQQLMNNLCIKAHISSIKVPMNTFKKSLC